MPKKQPAIEKTSPRATYTSQSQRGISVLVSSVLVLTFSYWWYLGGHQGRLIEINRASPLQAKFQVDINQADWPEIIQLPGLGETMAQRILADRRKLGPFREINELVRVKGIGPKTLEKIRPYLLPIPKDTDWAATERNDSEQVH